MEIYLIRHGIAVERGICHCDEERPLTDKGISKTTKVAQKLAELEINFHYLFSSPLVRAKETANILLRAGLASEIVTRSFLAPDGDINLWLQWLRGSYSEDLRVALVGHQPDLGNWASLHLFGEIKPIRLKKAGIIGIKVFSPTDTLGKGEMFLLTAPKWFTDKK